MKKPSLMFLLFYSVIFCSSLNAATTYYFSGVITESYERSASEDISYNYDRLFNNIEIGTLFSGIFVYDSIDELNPGQPRLVVNVGENIFSTDELSDVAGLSGSVSADGSYARISYSSADVYLRSSYGVGISFDTGASGLYTASGLPSELPYYLLDSAITFGAGGSSYSGFHTGSSSLLGNITSISTVPLPAAIWLMASGCLFMAGLSRRKK